MYRRHEIFSASEIAQYSYCPLSWYLGRQEARGRGWKGWLGRLAGLTNEQSSGQEEGRQRHAQVGQAINRVTAEEARSRRLGRLSMLLFLMAVVIFSWWLL